MTALRGLAGVPRGVEYPLAILITIGALFALALSAVSPYAPLLLLLLLAAGGVALLAVREPHRIGVPLLVIIIFSNASDLLMRSFPIPSLLQPTIALLALALWLRRGEGVAETVTQRLTWLLALYVAFAFATTAWAVDIRSANDRWSELAKCFAIYVLVASLLTSVRAVRVALIAFVATAAVLALLSVTQVATGNFTQTFGGFAGAELGTIYGDYASPRVTGPLGDPNFYAQSLLLALPLAVAFVVLAKNRSQRLLAVGAALLIGGAVLATYSRGAMVAAGVIALLLAWRLKLKPRYLALGGVALIAVLLLAPGAITARLGTMRSLLPNESAEEQDSSVEKRKLVVGTAWKMFEDHPLAGVGVGNFAAHFNRYSARVGSAAPQYDEPGSRQYPHSTFFEIAAETGLIGLVIYGAFILSALAAAWKASRRRDREVAIFGTSVFVALIGYLLTSIFLHAAYPRYLWLTIAFAAALSSLRTSEVEAAR